MFLDEALDRRKGVMIHFAFQTRCFSFHDYMFVHFVVAAIGYRISQFLVTAQRMSKQAEVPVRVIRMFQPATEKKETPIDPVAGNVSGVRNCLPKFTFRFRWQNFIGVEDEDPLIFEWKIFQGPVLLFWPGAVEMKLHHLGAKSLRGRSRSIATL